MQTYDSVVIGAGQAGLSAAYYLQRAGISFVVLDANATPGGAWSHRWHSLTMRDVHRIADLPGESAPRASGLRANEAVPAYFAQFEREHDLPIQHDVRVSDVLNRADGTLLVRSSVGDFTTRTLVNATGTWTSPFVPTYPGQRLFGGEQFHTSTYPGPAYLRGKRVLVVGAGASAVQFLGELAGKAELFWATRREPVWRESGRLSPESGRDVVTRVAARVAQGLPPASVVSETGLMLRPQEQLAKELGIYDRRQPMFARLTRTGVEWDDGTTLDVDVILWATGFRPAIHHLRHLHLRNHDGGVQLLPGGADVQAMTRSAVDARVNFVGYGPSASTVGAVRAGRAAARSVQDYLATVPERMRIEA